MRRDRKKIAAVIPNKHNITVMGAISDQLKRPFFLVADSTNEEECRDYFRQLKSQVKPFLANRRKPIIVLDNATAHKTAATMNVLNTMYHPLFLPSYSSNFNSVEWVWGLAKKEVRRRLVLQPW